MTPRTTPCGPSVRAGRWAKARQFYDAAQAVRDLAEEAGEVGDAYVTLCVHAGIAAADVICCARLGLFSRGDNHNEAVRLLESADQSSAKHLRTLLNLKTAAGYSHAPVSADAFKRAGRAMDSLIESARPLA